MQLLSIPFNLFATVHKLEGVPKKKAQGASAVAKSDGAPQL
jgi:hypothetical protein